MGSLGTLAASLKLEGGSQMRAGLASVGSAASTLTSSLSAIQGPLALLGVSFAAFKSVQGITDGLKGVMETARQLQTLSRATGESVGELKMLQGAFNAAGIGGEEVPNTLRAMQRAIGGVNEEGMPTSATLQRLGVNIQALKSMTATQQLQTLQKAFAKLPDASSQGAAAMAVFSREGQNMMALFRDPEAMAGLGKGLNAQAQIYQKNAATFARVAQDLQAIAGKTKGIFVGIAEGVAPAILPLLDKLKSVDLTRLGQQIGGIVTVVANGFKTGQIGALLGASLKVGAIEGTNALWTGLRAAAVGYGAIMVADLRTFAQMIDELSNPQNWTGVGHALIGAGFAFEAKLIEAGDYLQAGLDYAVGSSMHLLKTAMGEPLEFFQSSWAQAILDPIGTLQGILIKAGLGFGKAISEALHGNMKGVESAVSGIDNAAGAANPALALSVAFAKSLAASSAGNAPDFNAILQTKLGRSAGDRSNLNEAATNEIKRASTDLVPLATRVMQGIKSNLENVQKAVEDSLKAGPLLDASDAKQKFANLAGKLRALSSVADGLPDGTGGKLPLLSLGGAGKAVEGDRLARIGGFVGGAGGPALDFARRTAVGIEKTFTAIQTLNHQFGGAVNRDLSARWA